MAIVRWGIAAALAAALGTWALAQVGAPREARPDTGRSVLKAMPMRMTPMAEMADRCPCCARRMGATPDSAARAPQRP